MTENLNLMIEARSAVKSALRTGLRVGTRYHVLLPSQATGLTKDSVANLSQILTADKTFLGERAGVLPES